MIFKSNTFNLDSLDRELALSLNQTDKIRLRMIVHLSVAQKVVQVFAEFVQMKMHFRYHVGPFGKQFCFLSDCGFCQHQNTTVDLQREQSPNT
jgi:hypothetical protein